jgi:hypothetical protein
VNAIFYLKAVWSLSRFVCTFRPRLIKLVIGDVERHFLGCDRLRENTLSKSRTVLRGVNELLSVLSTFTDRSEWNSVPEICKRYSRASVSFVKFVAWKTILLSKA